MTTPGQKADHPIKHDDIIRLIENKYSRYIREIIDTISEIPNKNGDCEIGDNAWEDWRREQRAKSGVAPSGTSDSVRDACVNLIEKLPDDELALLWTMTHDYEYVTRLEVGWPYGEPMQSSVVKEIYDRIQVIAAAVPVSLHSFIMACLDDWNKDRLAEQAAWNEERLEEQAEMDEDDWNEDQLENPHGMKSAAKVTKTIWDADETGGLCFLEDNANTLTIADYLKFVAIDFFGGHQWHEMEDYINRLTPSEREMINLCEFIEIFYGVLCGGGPPD